MRFEVILQCIEDRTATQLKPIEKRVYKKILMASSFTFYAFENISDGIQRTLCVEKKKIRGHVSIFQLLKRLLEDIKKKKKSVCFVSA